MKTIFRFRAISVLLVVITVLALSSATYAAVRFSVSQQRVKTLQATLTYQDIANAPNAPHGITTERLVFIHNLPPDFEILSAYMKVTEDFIHPVGGLLATLRLYDSAQNIYIDNVSSRDISSGSAITNTDSSHVPVTDRDDIDLRLSVIASDGDLADLTAGQLKIYVNYLEH